MGGSVTLTLPADVEPYTTDFATPAVYSLDVVMPEDLTTEWDRRFETRAEWFDELQAATDVVYIGATKNLIGRLEDHRDRKVRQTVIPSLATNIDLRNAWPRDSAEQAFQEESKIAIRLRNHLPETTFVRQA